MEESVPGVLPEIAEARGYTRVETAEELDAAIRSGSGLTTEWVEGELFVRNRHGAEWYYPKSPHIAGLPGILMPLWWGGEVVGHDLRYDLPPLDKAGKPLKYLMAKDSVSSLDCPLPMQRYLSDPTKFLAVTEGVKKADALASVGVVVVGLRGVQNWSVAGIVPRRLSPQWDDVALEGRKVGIVFDSDMRSNRAVRLAAIGLADALRERGAIVHWALLPTNAQYPKMGIDDLFAEGYCDPANPWVDVIWQEVPKPVQSADVRPQLDISITRRSRAEVVDEAWELACTLLPPHKLVVHGSDVSCVVGNELAQHDSLTLAYELSRVIDFGSPGRNTAQGNPTWVSKDPPRTIIDTLLAKKEYATTRNVDRIVEVPTVGKSGKIITRPGLHPRDRLFYVPSIDLLNRDIKPWEVFGPRDIDAAKDLLLGDLLGDFSFVGKPPGTVTADGTTLHNGDVEWQANRANALALLLLPFVRDLIAGSTPLHIAVASTPGTGKGLLINMCLLPALGANLSVTQCPEGDNDDEWRKTLMSAMGKGIAALRLDNAGDLIDSRPLAAALTSPYLEGRILGTDKWRRLPVRHVWTITGNNTILSRELTRRSVLLHLDPGSQVPAERAPGSWKHPHLERWAEANRHELVCAALTLVNHYLLGEATLTPDGHFFLRSENYADSAFNLGSFEDWSRVVGGVLEACYVPHFMGNMGRLRASVIDTAEDAEAFLQGWHRRNFGPLSFSEVLNKCSPLGPLYSLLPSELVGQTGDRFSASLGSWLRATNGQYVGGYRLIKSGTKPRNRWEVVENEVVPA